MESEKSEKLARWASGCNWFNLDGSHFILPDGSVITIILSQNHLTIEKNGLILKTIILEELC